MIYFEIATSFLGCLLLGYYSITLLQWYDYKLNRTVFKHHKIREHLGFVLLPLVAYYGFRAFDIAPWFLLFLLVVYLPCLLQWRAKQDKPLVYTAKVKRFFAFVVVFSAFDGYLNLTFGGGGMGILYPLVFSYISLKVSDIFVLRGFERQARKKLSKVRPRIIVITASFGKTSIKNFVHHILSAQFNTYKTPKSVNTKVGIIQDVNENLPQNCDIYVVEAGARGKGDIDEIVHFLKPEVVVVGQIGQAHMEYFRTLENVRKTKLEILNTNYKKAFLHESTWLQPSEKVIVFGSAKVIKSDLDGLVFEVDKKEFKANVLGQFNVSNLESCIEMARYFRLSWETIKRQIASLKPVEHRLQRLDNGGKIILDDSYNGNEKGMQEAMALARTHRGRKVIVTPGLVESTLALNTKIANEINAVFDVAIITGELNRALFKELLKKPEVIFLYDKKNLLKTLQTYTKAGDLILFANDAPSFV